VAAKRRTDVGRLRGQLRGELDWVILKAMEKDRTRRYSSASELAADIERYLHHQPIQAHAPSTGYQLRKMVRRHTTAVGFAATVLILIIGFGIWMSFLYTRAVKAEEAAASEAETAQQVSDFMVGMFEVVDPSQALGETITAKEILDRGAEKIRGRLADQPLIQARLMDTMGIVYFNLGLPDKAFPLYQASLEIRERELGPESPEVATSLYLVSGDYHILNGNAEEGVQLLERALDIRIRTLGPDHVDVARTLWLLGVKTSLDLQEREKARGYFDRAQGIFERAQDDLGVAWCLTDRARTHVDDGNIELAVPLYRQALEIKETNLDSNHPDVAIAKNNFGYMLMQLGRFDEAEPYLRQSLEIRQRILPPEHIGIASSRHSLGELLRRLARYSEAEEVLSRGLTDREVISPDDLVVVEILTSQGALYRDTDRHTDSEQAFERAMSIGDGLPDPKPLEVATLLDEYADLLEKLKQTAKANELRIRAKAIRGTQDQEDAGP
jgi:tetratricopeptide (TPR) repeat protein